MISLPFKKPPGTRCKKINPVKGTPYEAANKRGLHFYAIVVPTHKDFLAIDKASELPKEANTILGVPAAATWVLDRPSDGLIGLVLFSAEQLSPENIAHEATHMALAYEKHRQKRTTITISHDEEPLAYAIGAITDQLVRFLNKHFS